MLTLISIGRCTHEFNHSAQCCPRLNVRGSTELAGLFNVEPLDYLAPPIITICVSDALLIISSCLPFAGENIGLFKIIFLFKFN
jgi:hypothetical protein